MARSGPKISHADILSFRLEVPLPAFQRLSEEGGLVSVEVIQEDEGERVLCVTEAECHLRFALEKSRARLTAVQLRDDERGLFLQRVLGPLMVQFRGDFHARVYWNVADRNREGDYAEVRIQAGETNYPGLAAEQPAAEGASLGGGAPQGVGGPAAGGLLAPRTPSPDDEKVAKLLETAKGHWEEYQRLKRERA
ncbi:MAG: hypothetical protein ACKVPX_05885 [Myxococcaceae bacterium]